MDLDFRNFRWGGNVSASKYQRVGAAEKTKISSLYLMITMT